MTPHPLIVEARAIRKDQGVSAREIAAMTGISKDTIGRWECGENGATLTGMDTYLRAIGKRLAILPADEDTWVVAVEVDAGGRPTTARLITGAGS